MTLFSALGFFFAMTVFAASPGPGVFAITSRALASGFKRSFALICGIILGDITFLLFAVFGLSMIAHTLGNFFFIIKIIGGAYLIFLGIKIWISAPLNHSKEYNGAPGGNLSNFTSGFFISLSNPKVILFYCGFLPNFLELSALTYLDLILVVFIVTIVLIIVLSAYALFASRIRYIFTNNKAARRINKAAGGLMIATGAVIASRT